MNPTAESPLTAPSVEQIQLARRELGALVRETPAWQWQGHRIDLQKPAGSTPWLKLELFQHTGSFKCAASCSQCSGCRSSSASAA